MQFFCISRSKEEHKGAHVFWMALLSYPFFSRECNRSVIINDTECNSYIPSSCPPAKPPATNIALYLMDNRGSVKRQPRQRFISHDAIACGEMWRAFVRKNFHCTSAVDLHNFDGGWEGTHSKGEGHFANHNFGCDPFRS